MFEDAHIYDDIIYDQILPDTNSEIQERYSNETWEHRARINYHLVDSNGALLPQLVKHKVSTGPSFAAMSMLDASSSTLTSLNLDWLIMHKVRNAEPDLSLRPLVTIREIFRLRFPCLRAFQLRNSVVKECELPSGLFLLDDCSTEGPSPEDAGKCGAYRHRDEASLTKDSIQRRVYKFHGSSP